MDFVANFLADLGLNTHPAWALAGGIVLLLVSGELVVLVLGRLENHQFGAVHLGALFTPLCTGFPNLILGIFGGNRLSGDLVLHLNIGNNIANASLVAGMLILICGPLVVKTGKSKAAKKDHTDFGLTMVFYWIGALAACFVCIDGRVSRLDGLILAAIYFCFQILLLRRRGTPPKRKRLAKSLAALLLGVLILAAILIAVAVEAIAMGMQIAESQMPGSFLGMFLGLLTVLPESFLLLRLAKRKGSLGLSGLVGDCLVSIPLVAGVAAMISPFLTQAIHKPGDAAAMPFWNLALAMSMLSLLSLREKPLPRKLGLVYIGVYALIWWLTPSL